MDDLWAWFSHEAVAATIKTVVKGTIMGAIAVATWALTRTALRHGEITLDESQGHTVQSPKLIVIAVLCGICAIAFLLFGILNPASLEPEGAGGGWLALVGSFTCLFVLLAMLSAQRWTWDAERVEWQGTLGKRTILWRELATAGSTSEGQYAARDIHGRKIRWSNYTLEHEALSRIAKAYLARNAASPQTVAA